MQHAAAQSDSVYIKLEGTKATSDGRGTQQPEDEKHDAKSRAALSALAGQDDEKAEGVVGTLTILNENTRDLPTGLRRAMAFEKVLLEMPIAIEPDDCDCLQWLSPKILMCHTRSN